MCMAKGNLLRIYHHLTCAWHPRRLRGNRFAVPRTSVASHSKLHEQQAEQCKNHCYQAVTLARTHVLEVERIIVKIL